MGVFFVLFAGITKSVCQPFEPRARIRNAESPKLVNELFGSFMNGVILGGSDGCKVNIKNAPLLILVTLRDRFNGLDTGRI